MRVLGKGNPEDRVLGPRARLKYKGKPITSTWIFDTRWFLLPSPPAPQRASSLDYSTPRTALPPPSPKLWADASPPLRCSLWREQSEKGNQDAPFPRGEAGALCGASNPLRPPRSLPSLLSANTPLLLPQRGFPSSPVRPLPSNFLGISHPVPFE